MTPISAADELGPRRSDPLGSVAEGAGSAELTCDETQGSPAWGTISALRFLGSRAS